MFTRKMTVPRITRQRVQEIMDSTPGLNKVTSIPVIETVSDAETIAQVLVMETLEGYEYISRMESVEETEEGWVFQYAIAGD